MIVANYDSDSLDDFVQRTNRIEQNNSEYLSAYSLFQNDAEKEEEEILPDGVDFIFN